MKLSGKMYLWRGALGGLTGGVVAEIILSIIQAGPRVNWVFFLLALLLTMVLGVIIGALVGAIIWKSSTWTMRETGPFIGAIIGASIVGMVAAGIAYVRYDAAQK